MLSRKERPMQAKKTKGGKGKCDGFADKFADRKRQQPPFQ